MPQDMQIVTKDAFRVVGIEVNARWDELFVKMPQAWRDFMGRAHELSERVNPAFWDVSYNLADGVYTQIVSADVAADAPLPHGMTTRIIPAGRYVYYRHAGPVQEIASAFGAMYTWAEQNGIPAEEFKLDYGYTPEGTEEYHDLYIRIEQA